MPGILRPALIALSIAVTGPAFAQDSETALNMSRHGTMTCAQFAALSPAEQDRIVRAIRAAAPPQSLTDNPADHEVEPNGSDILVPDRTDVPGTPLTAGELIGDCQVARPQATLREAFAGANSLNNAVPGAGD